MKQRWTTKDYLRHLARAQTKNARVLVRAQQPEAPLEQTTGQEYSFTVEGTAQPAGSKQAYVPLDRDKQPYRRPNGGIVVSVVDANPKLKKWQHHVVATALERYQGPRFQGAVQLTIRCYAPRPASHQGTKGLSKLGRETPFPISRPDVLKLARGIEDALTGVAWADDAQIVVEHLEKHYGRPRVEITIAGVEIETGQQELLPRDPVGGEIRKDQSGGPDA